MPEIHPTSILEGDINLADDVKIGPSCILRGNITLGAGVQLLERVSIKGPARIGAGTIFYPGAIVGYEPQDYKFAPGTPTAGIEIGDNCIIREHATVHAATNTEQPTRLGEGVFLMVNSHVGHDTVVGDRCVIVNNTCLAGHVIVEDRVTFSGGCLVHQHCRIGRLCMLSGGSIISTDLIPYCMTAERNEVVGLNLVGLRRSGMPPSEINILRDTFTHLLRQNLPKPELVEVIAQRMENSEALKHLHKFLVNCDKKALTPIGRNRKKHHI
ncbi:MAG: acyl-ACP--UDP-N-acetylglucosamine O-acyltransferase [Phycisphaerales bacterium]|nr:acyl-ACP--UDP-N-acetylglucosamine O-acyltransferase [Phycisphaerales bacterium]MCB9835320.1 acyl-ACP--UDP-N-acetylglucosamine O-acyltransferase [Phycisphaera sp.]